MKRSARNMDSADIAPNARRRQLMPMNSAGNAVATTAVSSVGGSSVGQAGVAALEEFDVVTAGSVSGESNGDDLVDPNLVSMLAELKGNMNLSAQTTQDSLANQSPQTGQASNDQQESEGKGGKGGKDDRQERQRIRTIRNRAAAQVSRERKRRYVEQLEANNRLLIDILSRMEESLARITKENESLRKDNRNLRKSQEQAAKVARSPLDQATMARIPDINFGQTSAQSASGDQNGNRQMNPSPLPTPTSSSQYAVSRSGSDAGSLANQGLQSVSVASNPNLGMLSADVSQIFSSMLGSAGASELSNLQTGMNSEPSANSNQQQAQQLTSMNFDPQMANAVSRIQQNPAMALQHMQFQQQQFLQAQAAARQQLAMNPALQLLAQQRMQQQRDGGGLQRPSDSLISPPATNSGSTESTDDAVQRRNALDQMDFFAFNPNVLTPTSAGANMFTSDIPQMFSPIQDASKKTLMAKNQSSKGRLPSPVEEGSLSPVSSGTDDANTSGDGSHSLKHILNDSFPESAALGKPAETLKKESNGSPQWMLSSQKPWEWNPTNLQPLFALLAIHHAVKLLAFIHLLAAIPLLKKRLRPFWAGRHSRHPRKGSTHPASSTASIPMKKDLTLPLSDPLFWGDPTISLWGAQQDILPSAMFTDLDTNSFNGLFHDSLMQAAITPSTTILPTGLSTPLGNDGIAGHINLVPGARA